MKVRTRQDLDLPTTPHAANPDANLGHCHKETAVLAGLYHVLVMQAL